MFFPVTFLFTGDILFLRFVTGTSSYHGHFSENYHRRVTGTFLENYQGLKDIMIIPGAFRSFKPIPVKCKVVD